MLRRCIIHFHMDAVYASVEQRDNPALRRWPVAASCKLEAKSHAFLQQRFHKSAAGDLDITNGEDDGRIVAVRQRKCSDSETAFDRDQTASTEIETGETMVNDEPPLFGAGKAMTSQRHAAPHVTATGAR